MTTLPLSGCSYGWLHQNSLDHALRQLATHGYRTLELTTAPPHLFTSAYGPYERQQLLRTLNSLSLQVISVNPSFGDLNLVSTNPEIRAVSEAQIAAELELAADLGARFVVVIGGRRHQLAPAPLDAAARVLDDALDRLLERARRLGVTIALENNPYGFLATATELCEVVDRIDSPHLAVTYDVANALAAEDPSAGLRLLGSRLALAHISDTWKHRWAHTSVGRGEVDFGSFATTLAELGFDGPTVYELVDGEPPDDRLPTDLAALAGYGWSVHTLPVGTR
ncbi:sugar phosphate isomerase/epimerase family protein [Nocardia alni]|uniref:sugar phosphate isomerase/epimerase family protein n=1 Tax=Nocardia alni TaxID=2815723 RepID=UPI001C246AC4|nr:sugar phosphate isomerase/epimerase family protein [Nocardia alni]